MNDLFEVRLNNARFLCRKYFTGTQSKFASAISKSTSYVNSILNDPNLPAHKNIGEKVARQIEESLGLKLGWMDEIHSDQEITTHTELLFSNRRIENNEINNFELIKNLSTKFSNFNQASTANQLLQKITLNQNEFLFVMMNGKNMEPRICDGDLIVIDKSEKHLSEGNIFAINIFNNLKIVRIFMRSKSILLMNDNQEYPNEEIFLNELDNIDVVGKVIWLSGAV